jgi:hypothetical protein
MVCHTGPTLEQPSPLELDQKTSDVFCHGRLSDAADAVETLHELNGKLESEPWKRWPSGTIFPWT